MPNINQKSELAPLETMRHSFAHVLAQAVERLYPGTKLGIGPVIKHGFYYDLDIPSKITKDDLPKIEEEMKRIIDEELSFKQIMISHDQAIDTLNQLGQIYKAELLQQINDPQISFYKTGEDFIDLCRGPHVRHTGELKVFRLTSITATHWLGDPFRPEMQRVEGVAFRSQKSLDKYFKLESELKGRHHKILGKEKNLFLIDNNINQDSPQWLPMGIIVKNEIVRALLTLLAKNEFQTVETPDLAFAEFYNSDQHLQINYKAYIQPIKLDDQELFFKTKSCHFHSEVFSSKTRSFRDLPMRLSEIARLYQNKEKVELDNLMNMRMFNSLTGHVYCSNDQIATELHRVIILFVELLKLLGFKDYKFMIEVPAEESFLEFKNIVTGILESERISFRVSENNLNRTVLTKVIIKDIYDNEREISNFYPEPAQKGLQFALSDGAIGQPLVIHVNTVISIERLFAILLEYYVGNFPLKFASIQVVVIPISEKFNETASGVMSELLHLGFRTTIDMRNETMQSKIRSAQLQSIPYMLILGEREINTNSLSVRTREGEDLGLVRIEEFIQRLQQEVS